MTVSSIVPVNTYAGNGSVNRFDFDYLVENPSQLLVQLTDSQGVQTDLVYGVDYSIDKFNELNGSFIIYPLGSSSHSILSSEEKITLSLELDIEQEKEYENSSKLYLETLEFSLDYLTRICQIQQRQIDRALKVQEGSDIIPDELIKELFEAEVNAKNSANEAAESARIATEQATIAVDTVTGFDAHAKEKQDAFDNNYNDKLVAFNINAVDKQNDFDINAATLTARFDNNYSTKTNDFDAHAMETEIAFDDNAAAKQALVDASAAAAKQSEINAKNSENASGISEDNARESERKSRVWAEGVDSDVANLGGVHSSKVWSEIAQDAVIGKVWVTLDTDQEIDSSKTFLKDQGIKSPTLDIRTDRNKRGNGLIFSDKNGTQTAGIGPYVNNNGSPEVRLIASNGTKSAFAGLGTTKDGQGFFWGPEPAEGANNEDYVTSHWVQRELTKNYVAKKGDTMTGALKFGTSGYIEANKSNSTKGLAMFGSIDGYAEGASLALRDNLAEGTQAGAFKLETGNNVTGHTHTLQGNPDGSFTCDGKEIVRTINGIEADKKGNVVIEQASNGYLVGSPSYDEKIYNQMEKQYHSTFDKSKFTVVGSPSLTSTGILSNCSSANKIETVGATVGLLLNKSWTIEDYVTLPTTSNDSFIKIGDAYNGTYTNFGSVNYFPAAKEVLFKARTGTGANNEGVKIKARAFNPGETIYYKLEFIKATGAYNLYAGYTKENSNLLGTWICDTDDKNLYYVLNHPEMPFAPGGGSDHDLYIKSGSIDLKQFSISVDGKEVFNGNKTGIDIIKPDNFTKVGNPVISEDGVATFFEYSQKIDTGIILPKDKDWSIKLDYTYISSIDKAIHPIIGLNGGENYNDLFRLEQSGSPDFSVISLIKDGKYFITPANYQVYPNKNCKIELQYSLTDGYKVIIDGVVRKTLADTTTFNFKKPLVIGGVPYGKPNFKSNLNAFKIYVDGKLVYQPLLRVPYNLTKHNEKYVEGVYRDRVIDVVQQYGKTIYPTIDTTNKNFMIQNNGIYGFEHMERLKPANNLIMDKVINGVNVRLWEDGTLEQSGKFTIKDTWTVTLARPYANTDYLVYGEVQEGKGVANLGIDAKTTTNFSGKCSVTTHSAYWYTKGIAQSKEIN